MGFVGVYRSLYEYEPQAGNELQLDEGDLLLIIEKSTEDDWWRAKKKAIGDEEHEPEGLIPNNYVEEAHVLAEAKALYDYSRQTDEELSFTEDTRLHIYDTSDPDWTLVGISGEYGFVPANYIEAGEEAEEAPPPMPARPRAQPEPIPQAYPSPPVSPEPSPAAALAGIIQQKTGPTSPTSGENVASPRAAQFSPAPSDDEPPPPTLPQRPPSRQLSPPPPPPKSPPPEEGSGMMGTPNYDNLRHSDREPSSPSGYKMYSIHEMISHQGKNRKMPTTLGVNTTRGFIMLAPEKSRDGPQKEWPAEKLTHYSIEGKHVFMELVRPSRSIDFHAGSKDTAHEIISVLGDLAGAARGEGLQEIVAASAKVGQKKGHMLYEFMAQGDDEVTVAVGDEVIVLDDSLSEEWWNVRRVKNGHEGVVPSSYVEVTGTVMADNSLSMKEQSRREEERMTREALASSSRNQEVGPGLSLPDRQSSLGQKNGDSKRSSRSKRNSHSESKGSGSKPDASKVRTWTDRSGSFKVDAQFIGLHNNKIHLHKVNGVKIAVAVSKMSIEDIEYVERSTGTSLDEDKPLSEIKRRSTQRQSQRESRPTGTSSASGATVQSSSPQESQYDGFDFFLQCGVNPQICERYANAFARDQMGEENLPDIDAPLLRTLGLKEGDILRVIKFLDSRFGRTKDARSPAAQTDGDAVNGDNSLFSGPGGTLRNNTRKGRPAPAVQSNDTVDPRAFEQSTLKKDQLPDTAPTPLRSAPTHEPEKLAAAKSATSGFDDDAWDVKPSRTETPPRITSPSAHSAQTPNLGSAPTSAMSELSILSPPLQPTQATPSSQQPPQSQAQAPPQPQGADPSFFDKLAQPVPNQTAAPRQRPQPTQQIQNQSSLIPPPPQRPNSAPQNQNQQSNFAPPPLKPQNTGNQNQVAPLGQSMGELNQQRYKQSFAQPQMYPQQTGFQGGIVPQPTGFQPMQQTGYGQFQQPQPTGFQPQMQQQFMNGQATGSPFADPPRQPFQPQPTGFQSSSPPPQLQPQQTGINSFLPPALQPQPTGLNGFGQNGASQGGFGQSNFGQQQAPPVPPIPQQHQTPAPLQPQKTGPAPPVRFGVTGGEKPLAPQPTGRRANLAQATPQNPFGF